MFKPNKLRAALLSALAASTASHTVNAQIEEVVVTATKRTASAQDIPVTLNAMSAETLKQLNAVNMEDFARYLPNVSLGARGPGQGEIYIRGMAVDSVSQTVGGAQAAVPNVAVYLDEQPMTSPSRYIDIYATDLARVEVLPGPQGTLFGASSMAGTVRLITNKAVINEFQAGMTAGVADTKSGDISNNVEGYINIPVIDDKLAVRFAAYNATKGGYIDNVAATRSLADSIPLNPTLQSLPSNTTYKTVSNGQLAKKNFNDATYRGFRASATYNINDNWDLKLQNMYQKLKTDGVFDYDPNVGDLKVQRFFPDSLDDTFNQTAWTVEGRVGALELLYTGAYLDRNIDQSIDYTGYNNAGAFIAYYTCTYTNPAYVTNYGIDPSLITPTRECLTPVKGAVIDQRINRMTHELRFNTPAENRWRVTAGVFYDSFELKTLDDFYYMATPDLGFAPNETISTAKHILTKPGVPQPPGVAFFNDIRRAEEQIAGFGELSFDIIPNTLTVTGGLRYYHLSVDFQGSSNFADGIFQGSVNTDRGRDYDVSFGHSPKPLKESDVIFKANISWTPTQDSLYYATYSQGFRPGGWNRVGGAPSRNPAYPPVPVTYKTDQIDNYEIGWKTLWFNGNLRFNGAAFFIDWTDMQLARFDPVNISILTFIDNAADAEIYGVEGDFTWAATPQLTVNGAFSALKTKLTKASSDVITLAPVGSQLPLAPPLQANMRARYHWETGPFRWHVQGGFQYSAHTYSALAVDDRRGQKSYIIGNVSMGVARDAWTAELFVDNLNDERAQLFYNVADDTPRITTNRPRTVGFRFSYDYQ
jgi:iron complex outermembrane receptor protein